MSEVTFKPFDWEKDEPIPGFNIEDTDLEDSKEIEKEKPEVIGGETPKSIAFEDGEENIDEENDEFGLKKPKKDKNEVLSFLENFEEGDEKEEIKEEISSDKVDYKQLAEFFIEKGIWADFEGKEDLEFTEEIFQQVAEGQAKAQVENFLKQEKAQFGETASQLIDFLNSGGKVDDFLSNYNQEVDIVSLDISDEDGQEKVLKEYFKSLDYPETKIKRQIERLKDEGEDSFKEEAEFAKEKLVKAIQEERDEIIESQKGYAEERRLQIQNFNKKIVDEIYSDSLSLADREKKELESFFSKPSKSDKQGNTYTEFALKRNDIYNDPKKFAKYIKFIKYFDDMEDKKTIEKETTIKRFNFLKEGQSQNLSKAVSKEPIRQKTEKIAPLKFK